MLNICPGLPGARPVASPLATKIEMV